MLKEARVIKDSPWGEVMIGKALKNNQDLETQLDALKKADKFDGNIFDWLKRKSGNNILLFLLLLLGSVGTIGILPLSMELVDYIKE